MDETTALDKLAGWCADLGCREYSTASELAAFRLPESQALVNVRRFAMDGWQLETQIPVPMRFGDQDDAVDVGDAIRRMILSRQGGITAEIHGSKGLTIQARLFLDGLSKHAFAAMVFELDKTIAQVNQLVKDMRQGVEALAQFQREAQQGLDEMQRAMREFEGEAAVSDAPAPAATAVSQPAAQQVTCPNCGQRVAGDKKFCIHCGQKLR